MNAKEAIDTLVTSYQSSPICHQVQHQDIRKGKRFDANVRWGQFLLFMAIGGFPSFVEDIKGTSLNFPFLFFSFFFSCSDCSSLCQSNKIPTFSFYQILGQEILKGHYGVAAFVVGSTFSSIPYLLIISLVPGAITYSLVGLRKSFEHFAYFTSLLFACMLLVKSLMMIITSIVPNFLMGIIIGARIQGRMMLNGGFFRLLNDIPKLFWRYPMYYISFHKYANQGFFKNEFKGLMFPDQTGGSPAIGGEEILRSYWQVEMDYSKWVDLAILLGMLVVHRLMVVGLIKVVEKMKPLVKNLRAKSLKRPKLVVNNLSTPK